VLYSTQAPRTVLRLPGQFTPDECEVFTESVIQMEQSSISRIKSGGEIASHLIYEGGLNVKRFDPHNRYAADEPGFGRAGSQPGGLGSGAFTRARSAAQLTTRDFFLWLDKNLQPNCHCKIFKGGRRE